MKGWWFRASNEERLAQIDGCLEVGMTGPQCAMNCGVSTSILRGFADYRGRHFDVKSYSAGKRNGSIVRWENGRPVRRRDVSLVAAKKAYEAGEPVDFWSAK